MFRLYRCANRSNRSSAVEQRRAISTASARSKMWRVYVARLVTSWLVVFHLVLFCFEVLKNIVSIIRDIDEVYFYFLTVITRLSKRFCSIIRIIRIIRRVLKMCSEDNRII